MKTEPHQDLVKWIENCWVGEPKYSYCPQKKQNIHSITIDTSKIPTIEDCMMKEGMTKQDELQFASSERTQQIQNMLNLPLRTFTSNSGYESSTLTVIILALDMVFNKVKHLQNFKIYTIHTDTYTYMQLFYDGDSYSPEYELTNQDSTNLKVSGNITHEHIKSSNLNTTKLKFPKSPVTF